MEHFSEILFCHLIAFAAGFLLDVLIGDPHWMLHPIRLIGKLIAALDRRLLGRREQGTSEGSGRAARCNDASDADHAARRNDAPDADHAVCRNNALDADHAARRNGSSDSEKQKKKTERLRGICLVFIVIVTTVAAVAAIIIGAYRIHPWLGIALEAILTAYALAATSLIRESDRVRLRLEADDLPGARRAVSMIVGRDTESLDADGVTRAAVETVAENASDGVIAPMLYLALGGPVLGFFYKATNTMDSMVGYQNDRYKWFGWAAARFDDLLNYIPSRIAALLLILASAIGGRTFSAKGAFKIWRRDRQKHKSPNAAQTESACAGALGIELAGDAVYFGKIVHKETIGDATRPIEPADIRRAGRLMRIASLLAAGICLLLMLAVLAALRT